MSECRELLLICRLILILCCSCCHGGTWCCSRLSTSRKATGSIPSGVGIFHRHNPGCIVAVGSTQPLTETSRRNIFLGRKVAGALGWQPYHLHVPIVLKSGSLNLLEPSGLVQACTGIALPLTCCQSSYSMNCLNFTESEF